MNIEIEVSIREGAYVWRVGDPDTDEHESGVGLTRRGMEDAVYEAVESFLVRAIDGEQS